MKTYLVFHERMGYRGFTSSKDFIKTFRRQRDMDDYIIYKIRDECELRKYGIDELDDNDEMYLCHNHILFRDEEEMFSLSIDQYPKDFRGYISHVLYYSQFMKLEEHEKECLDKFGFIIKELLDFLGSDESPEDMYSEIFNISKMVDKIT